MLAPIRIEIPAHDGHLEVPVTPPHLTSSPTKTPDAIARELAEREAKTK